MNKDCKETDKGREHFPPHTAGRLMVENVPRCSPDTFVKDILAHLQRDVHLFESINYIYVTIGPRGLLRGVFSIKEAFSAPKNARARDIMSYDIRTVRPHTDQEKVALISLTYNIKEVPVIDKDGAFLGVVPSDTILNVLYHELSEDISHFAGVDPRANVTSSLFSLFLHRAPLLLVGLAGGSLLALIVRQFEGLFSSYTFLIGFMPLVAYMAGATGTQMSALFIRDLAISRNLRFTPYFFTQTALVFLMSFFFSFLFFIIGGVLLDSFTEALVVAIALAFAMVSSLLTGLLLPFLLFYVKKDPAYAVGPIGTILQDIVSIIIYFVVASLLIM